jgi:hypothetical protein
MEAGDEGGTGLMNKKYYYHGGKCIKKLPGYRDTTSQPAGNLPLPGRPGSKIWIAEKTLPKKNRFTSFLAQFLPL